MKKEDKKLFSVEFDFNDDQLEFMKLMTGESNAQKAAERFLLACTFYGLNWEDLLSKIQKAPVSMELSPGK